MITGMRATRDAVVFFVAVHPDLLLSAHELAGKLGALEKNVVEVMEDLVAERLLVKVGENYRRPIAGEVAP